MSLVFATPCSMSLEQIRDLAMPLHDRYHQRCPSGLIGQITIGAGCNQRLDCFAEVLLTGHQQSRLAAIITRVYLRQRSLRRMSRYFRQQARNYLKTLEGAGPN